MRGPPAGVETAGGFLFYSDWRGIDNASRWTYNESIQTDVKEEQECIRINRRWKATISAPNAEGPTQLSANSSIIKEFEDP